MSDKTDWPQWLRDADTERADVSIENGLVVWNGGIWHVGIWHDGIWHGGVWHDGIWHDGIWHGGVWRDGEWCGGEWCDGEWCGGEWCGGVWRGGVWSGGASSPTRAAYTPLIHADGTIAFGCERHTRSHWGKVIAGEVECDEAPERGSEAWRLLVAAYKAACAYADALAVDGGEG